MRIKLIVMGLIGVMVFMVPAKPNPPVLENNTHTNMVALVERVDAIEVRLLAVEEKKVESDEVVIKTVPEESDYDEVPLEKLPNDFIRFVIDHYVGRDWYRGGKPPSASHLESHGFERADLVGLSQKELSRLHGAIHENSMSRLRQAYSGVGRMVYQRKDLITTATPTQPVKEKKTRRMVRRCRNGRCYWTWE